MNPKAMATIVVGLNAALQKRFVLSPDETLVPGNVHRASALHTGVGGKGQDVAMTLHCLQHPCLLTQFIGSGPEGDQVMQMLRAQLGSGHADGRSSSAETSLFDLTIRPESRLRTCTSIVAADTTTELVEPSGDIAPDELQELLNALDDQKYAAAALCIMGSLPPGCADHTYADIYTRVATSSSSSTLCLIDSVAGLSPLLQTIATRTPRRGPAILKVNASELCKLAGVKKAAISDTGGIQRDELVQAVQGFVATYAPHALQALTAIAVTDGRHPGHLVALPVTCSEMEFRIFQLPVANLSVENPGATVYPIGAGDAVAAGMLAAWRYLTSSKNADQICPLHPSIVEALQGNASPAIRAILAAVAFGLACGSASCLQTENSMVDVDDAVRLYNLEGRPSFVGSYKLKELVAAK